MLIKNWLTDESRPINQLTLTAKEYVDSSKLAPSRPVGVYAFKNLCSVVPSEKMALTVSTESHSAERAFALLCECDDNILGYYDQPQPIMVKKTDKNGKARSISYTPDFLIETGKSAFVVEVKTFDQAVKLTEKEPSNWVKSNDNVFEYAPAKEAFSKIGLKHYVWVYNQDMAYFISNLHLIYFSRSKQSLSESIASKINGLFDQSIFWTMYDFRNALNLDSYTEIFRAIDGGIIKANIKTSLLSNPRSVLLARDNEMLEIAISQNSRKSQNFSFNSAISIQHVPTENEAKKVLKRQNIIASGEKSRNVRRWNKRIEWGLKNGLSEFESLIDKSSSKGNRQARINKTVLDYLDDYLKNEHGNLQGISNYRSYIRYSVKSKEHHPHYDPVSLRTFTKHLKKIPCSYIAFQRGGRRLRNGLLEPTDPLKRNLKPQLPWQSAAIDEYLADIYLVFYTANGQRYEVRPWIAAMIDLATSKILALSLSFNNPSKRSLAKVIRECVRNHGKLPQEILFDRGSNYKSKYAAELLASLGVINTMRPAAYSRSGGEVESLFGEFKKQWLTQRPGNLADYKESRSVDSNKSPKKRASIKPYDFYKELTLFSEWRDSKPSGFHSSARVDRFKSLCSKFPFLGIEVEYDEKFALITAVDIEAYSIDFQRGLHIGEQFFWSPELSQCRGRNKKVEVRVDPENPHVVYALIGSKWTPCYSAHARRYESLDHESKLMEGLISLETKSLKDKLKKKADKALVNIISDIKNLGIKNNQVKTVTRGNGGSGKPSKPKSSSIFDRVKTIDVKQLKSEKW